MDLVTFAAEFVGKARACINESPGLKKDLFTSRQSQAICAMGTCRILRTGESLGIKDLVSLASITSPPEAKNYAEMIALRVLLGGDEIELAVVPKPKKDLEREEKEKQARLAAMTGATFLLERVLDFLNLERSVDVEKDYTEMKFAEQAESELFSRDRNVQSTLGQADRLDLLRKRLAYQAAGGRDGIIRNRISSWDGLFEQARREIMKSVPLMDEKMLLESYLLDMMQDVLEINSDPSIQRLADLLDISGTNGTYTLDPRQRAMVDDLSHRELEDALSMFNELDRVVKQAGLDKKNFSPKLDSLLEALQDRYRKEASNFDDVLRYPHLFDDVHDLNWLNDLAENTWSYTAPLDFLEKAVKFDEIFNTNMASRALGNHGDDFDSISTRDLLARPMPCGEWVEMVDDRLENVARQDDPGHWNDLFDLFNDLTSAIQRARSLTSGSQLTTSLNSIRERCLERMIESSTSYDELKESVDAGREQGHPIDTSAVRRKGEELGLSRQQVAELIGDIFEAFKLILEDRDPGYQWTKRLLRHASFPVTQRDELIDLMVSNERVEALGAFSMMFLEEVYAKIPTNEKGQELMSRAIGAAPGEDLLTRWFTAGKRLPAWLRKIMKDQAKRIIIDLAKARAANLIGSSEAGSLPEGTTRPFMLGDDPDAIDIDDTIENVLDLGKRLEQVTIDDFIVRKEVSGRRCVVFLVDVSGSMSGAPLAQSSIVTAMLLITFARDELSVALFESNTHVICEIDEKVDLDTVVDEILELEAMGGTQMGAAVKWASQQFQKTRSQDKAFIMVTDAMLHDFQDCQSDLAKIAEQGATSVLIVPKYMVGAGNIQEIVEAANASLIPFDDWKNFPDLVSRILSR